MSDLQSRPASAVVQGAREQRAEARYQIQPETEFINFGDILGALRRNLWLVVTLGAMGLAASAYLVSQEIQLYTANAVIRLVDRSSGVTTPISTSSGSSKAVASDPIQSEILVLTGRTVLGRAVDRVGLQLFSRETRLPANFVENVEVALPPEEQGTIHLDFDEQGVSYGSGERRRRVAYGDPISYEGVTFRVPKRPGVSSSELVVRPRDTAIDVVGGLLTAFPDEATGGIQVAITSVDPKIAPRIVNAVVEVYQEVNVETARENVRRRRVFLEDQLRETDSLLMSAQADLSGLRSREQAYTAAGRFTSEQGNLISLEIRQAELRGDLQMYENFLNQIVQARATGREMNLSMLMSLPGISADPNVSSLHGQLVSYMNARDTMLTGPWARAATHPEVQRLNTLIPATEEKLIEAARNHITSIRAQIASVGGLMGRSVAKMSELPRTEVEEMYLTQNLTALQQTGDQLREQYQSARLEEAGEAGQVEIVQLATRALPQAKSPWMKLFVGLLGGLMLGCGLALVRERMDRSINRPEEIEQFLMIPNLAVIPEASTRLLESGPNGNAFRSATDPPGAEAYRVLRTNLLFSQGHLKTMVVTSATPGEGKTMTAANLAAACARQGKRVLLMECDLRRPSLTRYFKSKAEIDVSHVLTEGRPWQEAVRPSGVAGLDVMLAAKPVPQAGEILAGSEMEGLLAQLSASYDLVILDTSPLLVAADAIVLGAIVDGVLLVVRTTHTNREAVQQAVHQLSLVGAHIVGTVLNDPEGAVGRYGHYYYDYSYSYEAE